MAHFYVPTISNTNTAVTQSCQVGTTLALLNVGSLKWCMVTDLQEMQLLLRQDFVD
jgi:hypothetical protein